MSRKIVIVSVLTLLVLFAVSCNTYQRCPAYGSVEVNTVDTDKV